MTRHTLERSAAIIALLVAAGSLAALGIQGTKTARDHRQAAAQLAGGDVARGEAAIVRAGCGTCHKIAGITGANGRVGPDLSELRQNVFIAGVASNRPENVVQWIMDPRAVDARTAMPDLGIGRQTAQDIAAYLYASGM